MNLKQLYYFKRLSETEHYTEAASSLCITQPSLSHAISELEKELGVALFARQGRNVKITQNGKRFLLHAAALPTPRRQELLEWAATR